MLLLPALALVLAPLAAPAPPDDPAPTLEGLEGLPVLALDGTEAPLRKHLAGTGLTVLAWGGVGCPIAGKYAPRLTELAERFAARGVRFVGINANPQDSREDIAREIDELGIEFPVVRDFRQEVTRHLDARTTTTVCLFDGQGVLRYRGAVDDQYTLGAARPAPTENWLADAIVAVLAGNAPPETETEAAGCLITPLHEDELPEAVTWSKHVAAIVQQRCEVCHRPGQAGPFSLQTYEQARGWARMIASVVDEGRMPPWNADEKHKGLFKNERRLPADEKELLLRWVQDGMPRGNPDEDPPARVWVEGWTIGEPDVVLVPDRHANGEEGGVPLDERGYAVPREGVVEYQHFTVATSWPEDRWIQAIETRPGAADVVHHVLVILDDPRAGSPENLDFRSYLAASVPGETSYVYPEGYAKRLPAGATLVFQIHYTPNGKERYDLTSLGLVFADEAPLFEVQTTAVVNQRFTIPAGASNHEVRGEIRVGRDTGLLSYLPHMHTRGKDFKYVAHYPDGESEELLFSHYDFNWQESYVYHDPLPLPAGTTIECIAHYDNSADNPNNPDPESDVRWGDQTFEEMFIGYFDVVWPIE